MVKNKTTKLLYSLVLAALVFTLVDGFVHYYFDYLEISAKGGNVIYNSNAPLLGYMLGKFIGTVILGYLAVYFLSKQKLKNKLLYFTAIIVGILEIRYYFSGDYSLQWHLLNISMHSIILYITSKYFISKELQ